MIYAFIPARFGSTRLKNKNYKDLKGKKLFQWSIELADKVSNIDKIIFSSDSSKYIQHAESLSLSKKLIIDKRNKENSNSKSKIYDYLKTDFLINNQYLKEKDYIVMLLPTQPYRSITNVNEIINIAKTKKNNVFTCREYSFPISFSFQINDKEKFNPLFDSSPLLTGNTQSQDQKKYFHPDGSVYVLKVETLKKQFKSIYENSIPFDNTLSIYVDIDHKADLIFANSLTQDIISK